MDAGVAWVKFLRGLRGLRGSKYFLRGLRFLLSLSEAEIYFCVGQNKVLRG